jgi:hypothetical protein
MHSVELRAAGIARVGAWEKQNGDILKGGCYDMVPCAAKQLNFSYTHTAVVVKGIDSGECHFHGDADGWLPVGESQSLLPDDHPLPHAL